MSGDLSPFREIIADDLFPVFSLNDDLSLNNIKPVPYEHPFNFYDSFSLLSDLMVLPKVHSNSDLQSFLLPSTTQKKKRSKTVKSKREDFSYFLPIIISRKCEHCKTARTPQWRGGPSGKGSLCNACGIRYSSNRLFPEYRPGISSGKDLIWEVSTRIVTRK